MTEAVPIVDNARPSSENKTSSFLIFIPILFIVLIAGMMLGQAIPLELPFSSSANPTNIPSSSEKNNQATPLGTLMDVSPEEITNVRSFTPIKLDSEISVFAFPLDTEKTFYTVSLPPEEIELKKIDNNQEYSSITAVIGSTSVSTSPNGKVVAYATNDGRLALLSGDHEELVTLPKSFKVANISWWSPDSKKLVVYVAGSIGSPVAEGPGDESPTVTLDKEALPRGPYVVDLEKGVFYRLPDFMYESFQGYDGVLGWVGNDELLLNFSYGSESYKFMSLFNVSDYVLKKQNIRPENLNIFSLQMSINTDGTRWVYDVWPTEGEFKSTTVMRISDFPGFEGTQISTGISAQWPLISPDGKKVAYIDQPVLNEGWYTYVWNNNNSTQLSSGMPLKWIDDTHLIVAQNDPVYSTNYSSHLNTLHLFDISTGQSQILFNKN